MPINKSDFCFLLKMSFDKIFNKFKEIKAEYCLKCQNNNGMKIYIFEHFEEAYYEQAVLKILKEEKLYKKFLNEIVDSFEQNGSNHG